MEYVKLTALWIGWCFLHSILITPTVTRFVQKHLGDKYRFFRLFYNIVAIVSLILIWQYHPVFEDSIVFSWDGYPRVIQLPILALSIGIFLAGSRNYDMRQFLGLRQLFQKQATRAITKSGGLAITGILRYTRHPWYLGGILFIWTDFTDLLVSRLIMNVVWTMYFIFGAVVEERKLVTEFGDQYCDYQKQVSMLIPFKRFVG
jgi:protein-S-isoprenylcysteine O-methyltransferase Ste14